MLVLITYDVRTMDAAGKRRLRQVSRACLSYGQRVQNSVFECVVDATQFKTLKLKLIELINQEEDSLRFYQLGNNHRSKVEHVGAKSSFDVEGPLIF
ncbi:CRISPR-associated endonuclease Cas2 [Cohnella sp. REN36]|uniref:CRISPR-associated endonuclease Cas2 n=1 Tax=Cohnella sp. REN36 TaxID=2887347 RepID=UPI001D154FA6|nr:CRISPR-associated endonuclease Cas2 [Cohnella sp. REN36]MCC3372555.1 CRISPR-associated endonuclease Cas2 [Cohnella sp. REN36]